MIAVTYNGMTIDSSKLMDGVKDLEDGSDENEELASLFLTAEQLKAAIAALKDSILVQTQPGPSIALSDLGTLGMPGGMGSDAGFFPIAIGGNIASSGSVSGIGTPPPFPGPTSVGILYANHTVQQLGVKTPFEHSKLVISIDNTSKHWGTGPFSSTLEASGIQWITIGAGPDTARDQSSGRTLKDGAWMWAATNRDTDVRYRRQNEQAIVLPAQYSNLDDAIDALLALINTYNNNPVHYTVFPGQGTQGLNSNGFVHGLLNAGGFTAPTSPGGNLPGWNLSVAPGNFGVGP